MGKIGIFIGIMAVTTFVANPPRFLTNRATSASSPRPASTASGDIRVNTPHGKKYMGVPYFGTTTKNGKRYNTITTYHYRK